jgi:perosamine synthetase
MIPRKRIDIGWPDLASGILGCFAPGDAAALRKEIEASWDDRANLTCLSVRSGFDALLSVLALPAGSEVLVSAVNIADMPRILKAHGLVSVPVDIDMQTLEVSLESLARARTPRTRMLLIAHLFGSRMPMRALVEFSRKNIIFLIEDCAQAYTGDNWRGEPEADVRLFSFGPVKPATALGGAVLGFRDQGLRDRVRSHMARWPQQLRSAYLLRLIKYLMLAPFANRVVYGLLASLCRWCGTSHEKIVSSAVRGFGSGDFFARIRQQPCAPLLRLLRRRLQQGVQASAVRRIAVARQLQGLLRGAHGIGMRAAQHRHWIFPLVHDEGDALIRHLAAQGFDAAYSSSSLGVIAAASGAAPAAEAARTFAALLYLPAHEGMNEKDVARLAREIAAFEQGRAPRAAGALEMS